MGIGNQDPKDFHYGPIHSFNGKAPFSIAPSSTFMGFHISSFRSSTCSCQSNHHHLSSCVSLGPVFHVADVVKCDKNPSCFFEIGKRLET